MLLLLCFLLCSLDLCRTRSYLAGLQMLIMFYVSSLSKKWHPYKSLQPAHLDVQSCLSKPVFDTGLKRHHSLVIFRVP